MSDGGPPLPAAVGSVRFFYKLPMCQLWLASFMEFPDPHAQFIFCILTIPCRKSLIGWSLDSTRYLNLNMANPEPRFWYAAHTTP